MHPFGSLVWTHCIVYAIAHMVSTSHLCGDSKFDPSNDTWVLCNMFGNITELYEDFNWFSTNINASDPCIHNWEFVTCNTETYSRIISLSDFRNVGNENEFINTTYWPQKIETIMFWSSNFRGQIHLDNLPNTTQTVYSLNTLLSVNMTQFNDDDFDLSYLNHLQWFAFDNLQMNGDETINSDNLLNKLPQNSLERFELSPNTHSEYHLTIDKFPNFVNFSKLWYLQISYVNIIDTDSFVNTVLPPKMELFRAIDNGLTGHLIFATLMANYSNVRQIYIGGNNFDDVDFNGLNEDTPDVRLDLDVPCSYQGYSIYKSNYDYDYYDYNDIDINVEGTCADDRYSLSDLKCYGTRSEGVEYQCSGIDGCYDTCECFGETYDWQPAINDIYTISIALIMISTTMTGIAFTSKWNQLLYLKILSIQYLILTIHWIVSTLILPNLTGLVSNDFSNGWFSFGWAVIGGYTYLIVYPCTIFLSLSNDYNNFYFMKQFDSIEKVSIDAKYHDLVKSDKIHGKRYIILHPASHKRDESRMVYFKIPLKNKLKDKYNYNYNYCSLEKLDITLSHFKILYVIVSYLLIIGTGIYLPYAFDSTATFGEIIETTGWIVFLCTSIPIYALLSFYTIMASSLGKYRFFLVDLMIVLPLLLAIAFDYVPALNGDNATRDWCYMDDSGVTFLFRSNTYFGVIDELGVTAQGYFVEYYTRLSWVLLMWAYILFGIIVTLLYIKKSHSSTIKGLYMNQASQTITGVFSGLLDYLTDALLIIYWILNQLYIYAFIQLFFILFAQIVTLYLIKYVSFYTNCSELEYNQKEASEDDLSSSSNDNKSFVKHKILKNIAFIFGLGRIYYSVHKWDNKLVEYKFKWCKLWELIFETMPSVMLSTYVTLIESLNGTTSISVAVSLVFSFMNMTNIIVNCLKDRKTIDDVDITLELVQMRSHNRLKQVIAKNENINDNKSTPKPNDLSKFPLQLQLPNTIWITNDKTGDIDFFDEKKLNHNNANTRTIQDKCANYGNKCCFMLFRFELKFDNFIIWIFLTSDLFLKILSSLSIIVFINCLFNGDVNVDNNSISLSLFYATVLNIMILCFLLIIEYRMFAAMLEIKKNKLHGIILMQYFAVGIFSNCLYFLFTIGLKYMPKIIDNELFFKNQRWRIILCCLFVFLQIVMNVLFVIASQSQDGFSIWIFGVDFYLWLCALLVTHLLSFVHVKKKIMVTSVFDSVEDVDRVP